MGRRPALGGASKAVAIKLLAKHIADDPGYRQMFVDEARLSMLLTNSNVVQVFDVGEVDGECFMVMEWVDGLNLAELTRNMLAKGECLSTELSAHVIGEVLRGLTYAHTLHHDGGSATIVHRDVSPQNVLCSVSGEVKLADFGVARLAREETSGLHVKGKLRYMAPEQLRGRSREPTVDLYAVGAMLHELLSGNKFRKTNDENDLYSIALSGEYPPLPASVPVELANVCKRLLEPDATLRIQAAEAALELLARWPGYRNGSIELGRFVREYSGIAGPRSGIVHFPPTEPARPPVATAATTLGVGNSAEKTQANPMLGPGEPSVQTGTPTEVIAPRESGPLTDQGATVETRTWTGSGPGDATRPELQVITSSLARSSELAEPAVRARSLERRGKSPSLWLAIAAAVAVVFGVFGLGVGLQWWGPGSVAEVKQPEVKLAEVVEPKVKQPELKQPEVVETKVVETKVEEPKVVEPEVVEPEVVEPEVVEPKVVEPKVVEPKVDRTPATVELLAHDLNFVYVKIEGQKPTQTATLEPKAELELRPGRHKVSLRKADTLI